MITRHGFSPSDYDDNWYKDVSDAPYFIAAGILMGLITTFSLFI